MIDPGDAYPAWLEKELIADSFPWDKAQFTKLSTFLAEYTLGDSVWMGLWLGGHAGAVAVVRFETAWSKGRIVYEEADESVSFWPILLVRFQKLYQASQPAGKAGGFITEVVSHQFPSADHGSLEETVISDVGDGELRLVHDPMVTILCMRRSGEVIHLSDL